MELKGSEIIDIYIQGENIKSRDCFKFRICDGETSEKLTGCSHNPHARNRKIVFNYSLFFTVTHLYPVAFHRHSKISVGICTRDL